MRRYIPLGFLIFLLSCSFSTPSNLASGNSGNEPRVVGEASYYADKFHGRPTSTGERYDKRKLTAANKEFPVGTILRVRRLDNGKSVEVRVNDCGPFRKGRIIDLSKAAAKELDLLRDGVARVELTVVKMGTGGPTCNRSKSSSNKNQPPPPSPSAEPPTASKPAAKPTATETPTAKTGFAVQTAAFSKGTNADRQEHRLRQAGFDAFRVRDRELIRIYAGPYPSKKAAERAVGKLQSAGFDGWVVRLSTD